MRWVILLTEFTEPKSLWPSWILHREVSWHIWHSLWCQWGERDSLSPAHLTSLLKEDLQNIKFQLNLPNVPIKPSKWRWSTYGCCAFGDLWNSSHLLDPPELQYFPSVCIPISEYTKELIYQNFFNCHSPSGLNCFIEQTLVPGVHSVATVHCAHIKSRQAGGSASSRALLGQERVSSCTKSCCM